MARQSGVDAVRGHVEPVVSQAALHLEDITFTSSGRSHVVRITLDLPENETGSLDLDTLADVSRRISSALDAADDVPGPFTLEVTTPGVSRPLTELRHFRRARGRLVRLHLADGSTVSGRMREATPAVVHLACADGPREIPLAAIVKGHVQVEMSRNTPKDTIQEDAADGAQISHSTQEGA